MIYNITVSNNASNLRWNSCKKTFEAILLFVDFFKAFHSIHKAKLEQIQVAYGLPKETNDAL